MGHKHVHNTRQGKPNRVASITDQQLLLSERLPSESTNVILEYEKYAPPTRNSVIQIPTTEIQYGEQV